MDYFKMPSALEYVPSWGSNDSAPLDVAERNGVVSHEWAEHIRRRGAVVATNGSRRSICGAVVATFLLSACATAKEPGIEIREVLVPTPVACIRAEQIPAEPEKVGSQLSGDARHDLSVVAESALELRKYAGELRALISGCTE